MAENSNERSLMPGLPTIDLNEYGGKDDTGTPQVLSRRLFMQLLVFRATGHESPDEIIRVASDLLRGKSPFVLYESAFDPRAVGLLTWSERPDHFIDVVRRVFQERALRDVEHLPDFTMVGRTYSSGHEPRLAWWLLDKPVENALNESFPWAVWYPLRRKGAFGALTAQDQSSILREHAQIGFAYGKQELAHDIRLACHGMDAHDNDFVIGLIGKELHPLSHVVQTMRKTKQTSEFIEKMGPFFVGRAALRHA